jgi:hypothetical protein
MHHAKRAEASGFCYVNDIVLCILELLKVRLLTMLFTELEAASVGQRELSSSCFLPCRALAVCSMWILTSTTGMALRRLFT